jgi:hypothetical protein
MKKKNTFTMMIVLAILISIAVITLLVPASASAGEFSLYGKSGYFSLTETIDGQRYVREGGFISGAGASYSLRFARYLAVKGTLEGFFGQLDYQGVRLADMTRIETDTVYLGTREEVALAARIPVGRFSIGPTAGLGHKWFDRSRSDEIWSYFYIKGGAYAEYKSDKFTVSAEAGVMNQLDTSVDIDWSSLGYGKITCKPKGTINPYAELRVKGGNWFAAFFYEEANWNRSDNVPITTVGSNPNGAVLVDGQAFQPDTRSSMIGLEIGYEF